MNQTPEPLTDARLFQLRDDEYVCTNANERSMAAELIDARARIAELEAAQSEPDAYIAVKRTHSPNADRPEWDWHATVIPAGAEYAEDREWRLDRGFDLLPIVGTETGTRPATPQSDPAGYVVVTRNSEGGVHRSATVWDSLDQARAAEGVQAGYADGTGCTAAVYALREVQQ
ncbi:hypothetical protein ACFYY5_29225 [Nocardia elegans]|uniref:Uncharacterized protein n=1 Tax=Nocardia elegans TaxID=300029 RepID=A0ABW6TLD0_9NOCA